MDIQASARGLKIEIVRAQKGDELPMCGCEKCGCHYFKYILEKTRKNEGETIGPAR